ncbi:hypothetical protein CN213_16000 [Sinorhizobium meliloti]|uniref:hypothetical protein n=1 Tax=Rhizobium meliloti TaxID=382 RepID=UPI000FD7BA25|nr:hypothetical protein [Sinorhizobium meliloti]RVH56249.1 hypothetical protein CN213_16000 [Sinorhizobium meliloti]
MPLELSHEINLDSPEIYAFLESADSVYAEPIDQAYWLSLGMTFAAQRTPAPGDKMLTILYTGLRRRYHLLKRHDGGGYTLETVLDVILPVSHPVSLNVEAILLIKDSELSPSERTTVIDAFNNFTPGQDPFEYIADQIARTGISSDKFWVASRGILRREGAAQLVSDEAEALERLYQSENGYRLQIVPPDQPVGRFTQPDKGRHHVSDIDDDNKLKEIINEIISEQNTLDCPLDPSPVSKRIATILQWPEFMVEWRLTSVKIGCVVVKLHLPVLRTRTTKLALFVFVHKVDGWDRYLFEAIVDCAWRSAAIGAVTGLILLNFAAGVAAFRGAFETCITNKFYSLIPCLFPNLVVLQESSAWADV